MKESFTWKCGYTRIETKLGVLIRCVHAAYDSSFDSIGEAASNALCTHEHKDSVYVVSLNNSKYIGLAQGLVFNQK